MFYIYRITNKINGKTYIGQHKYTDLNDSYMGSGVLLHKAYKKYGKENFSKEIIYSRIQLQETADSMEKFAIAKERKSGKAEYNIDAGGHHHTDASRAKAYESRKNGKGWHSNEKSIKVLVEWTKKYGHSDKWRKEMSEKLKGHKDYSTKEGIEKMKKSIRELYDNGFQVWNKRKIICVETGQVFESQADAARFIGVHPSAIVQAMKNNGTSKGFHWKWEIE